MKCKSLSAWDHLQQQKISHKGRKHQAEVDNQEDPEGEKATAVANSSVSDYKIWYFASTCYNTLIKSLI